MDSARKRADGSKTFSSDTSREGAGAEEADSVEVVAAAGSLDSEGVAAGSSSNT